MAKPNYKGYLYRKTLTYNGKKYYVTSTDETDLMRKYVEKEEALKRGDIVVNRNTTVENWCNQWLDIYKKPKVKESTYNNIVSLFENNILPEIGRISIGDIKRINLQHILNKNAGRSYSLLSKIKIYLCDLFNAAERDEIIDKNPSRFLELPKYTKGTARVMTDEEYSAALELCKTHRAGLWIMLMMRCGLRRGETIPLVWSDVNFKTKTLTINKSVERVNGKPKLNDSAKSDSGNRKILIPDDTLVLLKEEAKNIKGFLIFTPAQGEKMLNYTQIERLWKSFKRELDIMLGAELYRNKIVKSKIEGLKLHGLRHTAITKLVENGAAIKDVQLFAGHADAQTTLNIYVQVEKDKAAKRILNIQNIKGESGTKSGTSLG